MSNKVVVLGAGGFIGGHLVSKLKELGYWVRGVDIKYHEYRQSDADEFIIADLRYLDKVNSVLTSDISTVYQLAADMGGSMYVFSGENDADILHNSCLINLNVCNICVKNNIKNVFYSSSACIYPEHNQMDENNPKCNEDSAYPANPDSEYGFEKLFSERLYMSFAKNKGLNVRIARFHNIFGPFGTWSGGKEKAPAALCRKVVNSQDYVDVFGDGKQTRSFLYIDECIEGILKLMSSNYEKPINIGSDEMVSINQLANMIIDISGKNLTIQNDVNVCHTGVRGRTSDNTLIGEILEWKPSMKLVDGLQITYEWIKSEIENNN